MLVGCVVLVRYIMNFSPGKKCRFTGTVRNGVEWDGGEVLQ